jgi:hypothetical protein
LASFLWGEAHPVGPDGGATLFGCGSAPIGGCALLGNKATLFWRRSGNALPRQTNVIFFVGGIHHHDATAAQASDDTILPFLRLGPGAIWQFHANLECAH